MAKSEAYQLMVWDVLNNTAQTVWDRMLCITLREDLIIQAIQ